MQPAANISEAGKFVTQASLFGRLNAEQPVPREMAWEEFRAKYGPIIAGFARNFGARPQDIEDLIQDVMLGFVSKAPTFVYDPSKGRFRGYMKVCTLHALKKRAGQDTKFMGMALDDVDPAAPEIDSVWEREWEQHQLKRALEDVRKHYASNDTFRAFEMLVLLAIPVKQVAETLKMSDDSVYQARSRVTAALRKRIAQLAEEEG